MAQQFGAMLEIEPVKLRRIQWKSSTKPDAGKIFEYHETFQVPFCARAPFRLELLYITLSNQVQMWT